MSLLWLLLWVVVVSEGEMEAGCQFTPLCCRVCGRGAWASKQAAPSTYPRTWVWKLLHQCQRRVASGGCGGGSLTASGWPDSWEEHQILTKWKSNRSSLEAELTADTYFNRNRCKGNNHSWAGCQKKKSFRLSVISCRVRLSWRNLLIKWHKTWLIGVSYWPGVHLIK